jgi:hypothetical protein
VNNRFSIFAKILAVYKLKTAVCNKNAAKISNQNKLIEISSKKAI